MRGDFLSNENIAMLCSGSVVLLILEVIVKVQETFSRHLEKNENGSAPQDSALPMNGIQLETIGGSAAFLKNAVRKAFEIVRRIKNAAAVILNMRLPGNCNCFK